LKFSSYSYTTTTLFDTTLTAFFNTLVFFLTEKTFQRQPEAPLPFLS